VSVESVVDARNNQIEERARAERVGRRWQGMRSVAPAEDLEEEKGDNTRMNNDNDQQHTTIKQNTVEVGGRRRRWRRR